MTDAHPAGVVVDTLVISWLFDERPNVLAERYRQLIGQSPVLLTLQTVMELRFGAIRAGGGEFPHLCTFDGRENRRRRQGRPRGREACRGSRAQGIRRRALVEDVGQGARIEAACGR